MTIKVGEKGQPFFIAAGFDLSGFTGLTIEFTAPTGGTDFIATDLTTPAVTAPAVQLNNDPAFDPPQTVAASTYFQYITDGTEFDIDGEWKACAFYTDASLVLNADSVTFEVGARCS